MYKALITFGGIISMRKGDTAEIHDPKIANELLKSGYIAPVDAKPKSKTKTKTKNK